MYVAVKGGEQAILNSWRLLAEQRRGDTRLPELTLAQIRAQLGLAVDRVMAEGSFAPVVIAARDVLRRRATARQHRARLRTTATGTAAR